MRISTFLIAASATLLCGAASAYTLTGFRQAPSADLHIPAVPDSISGENPFSPDKLLDSRAAIRAAEFSQNWTTMTADSAGRLTLVGGDVPRIHSVVTRLRANRFAKGKLVLNTPAMADILVNGQSVSKKTSTDSLPSDTSYDLELSPEADYEVQVNFVTLPDAASAQDFKLEFVPDEEYKDIVFSSGADMPRRVAPLTTMTGERVSGVSISPDGRYLVTRYTETVSADEVLRHSTLKDLSTGKILSENLSSYAYWMPKGSRLYYTEFKKGAYDVYTIEVSSMKETRIATNIPDGTPTFSPDEKYLFYYKKVDGAADEGVMRRVKSPDDRIPGNRERYYIVRYDLENRVALPLTYGGSNTFISDFSADGSKMLYLAQRNDPSRYPFYFSDLVQMDLKTLKTDTVIADNGYLVSACYSPDASRIFIEGAPQAFGDLGVNAGDHEIPNTFDNQGYIYTIATGDVKAVTRDFDPSIDGDAVWNRADGNIYFRGEAGFHTNLYRLDPKSLKITELDSKIPSVMGFSMGENDSKWLAYYGGDFTDTGMAYLLNLRTDKNTLIDDPMRPSLDGIEFGKMEPWQFTSSDGSLIDGYMCLPPDFDASRKYPLIVYYYGGTSPSTAAMYHLYSPQVFASRDYVVYVLNPSGTTGYGQEFSSRHVNAWGKRTAEEIIEGVKKFAAEHPFVDEKKIGCLGASYGGFMTQYLQTLTDIFAAAVSHAGISNVTSYWGEGYWGYSYNAVAAAQHYPWTDPELYTRQGSLFNADKIHTPLLLLHGKLDTNVPIGESIQLFNALRVLGREVEFITVEDENHVISNFDRKQVWQNTIMAWFAKWLQDDPRWWDSLYGDK